MGNMFFLLAFFRMFYETYDDSPSLDKEGGKGWLNARLIE
jgi:hypothetical protein